MSRKRKASEEAKPAKSPKAPVHFVNSKPIKGMSLTVNEFLNQAALQDQHTEEFKRNWRVVCRNDKGQDALLAMYRAVHKTNIKIVVDIDDLRRSADLAVSEAEVKLQIEDECPEEIDEIKDELDSMQTVLATAAAEIKLSAVEAMKDVLAPDQQASPTA